MGMGQAAYGCAKPLGIMRLLQHYEIPISGRHAVVVGRSPILGKPTAAMLLQADATVTICHSRTDRLRQHLQRADIVVGAVGRPELVTADWCGVGALAIAAGYHPGGRGDVRL